MNKFGVLRKLAKFTRRYSIPKIDKFLRLVYSPDKRTSDFIDQVIEYDNDLLIHCNTASFIEWTIFFYGYLSVKST